MASLLCNPTDSCSACVSNNSTSSTSRCVFCDNRCYSSAADNSAIDAFVILRCFDGSVPVSAIEQCQNSTSIITSTISSTSGSTTPIATTTASPITTTEQITLSFASTPMLDSSALTIGILAAFLLLCCLISSLLVGCYCLRTLSAARAHDLNDADVSLFDDYDDDDSQPDVARLDAVAPVDASRTMSTFVDSVAQSPPRTDGLDGDDEIIEASTLDHTISDLTAHLPPKKDPALDALMADLATVGKTTTAGGPNELAWQPDPTSNANTEAVSKRISVIAASSRPFVKKSSVRASISKRTSDRAITRSSVSKKTSERDISFKRGARKRASTTFADLAADDDDDDDDNNDNGKARVPNVGDSDSGGANDDDSNERDELPQTPHGAKPGNVFLFATEATHLAASGSAVSRVAQVVHRAVHFAQLAERAALESDDGASAAAIRAQMIASAQATKRYAQSPSKSTSTALGDVLAQLIAVTVVYDRAAASNYADELLADDDDDDDDDVNARKTTKKQYADELQADSEESM